MAEADSGKFFECEGPNASLKYPQKVQYCPVCDDWPLEYCEFHPNYDTPKFKEWAERNLTAEMQEMHLKDGQEDGEKEGAAEGDEKKKKRQTRGGKGMIKTKKEAEKERKVTMSRAPRGKKKYVTVVSGLGTFGIDLKKASKFFGSRFACGSSVTGPDEIVIQGDVKDDLWDVIPEHWPEIDEDSIDDLGDQKR